MNHLKMLEKNYGIDGIPIKILHNSERIGYHFSFLSMTISEKKITEIQINLTRDNKKI